MLEAIGVQRYTPPVPKVSYWNGNRAVYAAEKECNITFVFVHLDPPLGLDDPAHNGVGVPATPAVPRPPPLAASGGPGANAIQQGHNLVPYGHMMSWYYARTEVSLFANASDRPLFPSMPFELLFSNPGVVA